ncbi:MAG TPA: MoxR family ATPase, partial [Chroococcales cyanobacterium]
PEAQLDRFMLKVLIAYPSADAEKTMLENWQNGQYKRKSKALEAVTTAPEILSCRAELDKVKVDGSILMYLVELVQKSRTLSDLQLGASPRAALNWLSAAKAHAAIDGKDFVTPDNIKFVAEPVLRHRLILTPESELDGVTMPQVIANLLKQIPVPR